MKYGSVCSGIEAATVAWHPLGWEPQWFAEIEAFPSAVLKHHYPDVPNLGNFTMIGEEYGPIELLVGGTPCQSFSVAGKRLGMDDPRGNLAIEFLRLAQRLRPRWVVFENVPGLLSSDEGRDFHTFLSLLGECGYGYAYRVLDAQYFGVPQRRRRVFVVGYFGDWRPAAAVLLERESLSRHPAPRREAGERIAGAIAAGAHPSGFNGRDAERGNIIARCVTSRNQRLNATDETLIPTTAYALRSGAGAPRDEAHDVTLVVKTSNTKANGSNVGEGVAFTLDSTQGQAIAFSAGNSANSRSIGAQVEQSPPLKSADSGTNQVPVVAFDTAQITSKTNRTKAEVGLPASTLNQNGQMHIAFTNRGVATDELAETLRSGSHGAIPMTSHMTVRRLTPRECERLQGFPDDYTLIPFRGKQAADGPRYRALGNSMAVPVMAWIGQRIQAVECILAHAQASTQEAVG